MNRKCWEFSFKAKFVTPNDSQGTVIVVILFTIYSKAKFKQDGSLKHLLGCFTHRMIHLDSSFWKSRLPCSLRFYYISSLVLALPHK